MKDHFGIKNSIFFVVRVTTLMSAFIPINRNVEYRVPCEEMAVYMSKKNESTSKRAEVNCECMYSTITWLVF